MDKADLRRRLEVYRSQCLSHMQRASAVLEAATPDATTLAMMRWQYVRLLTEFESFKHREIFGPALRNGTPGELALARDMATACEVMGQAFRAYVLEWSTVDKNARWEEYSAAAKAIIQRLHDHFEAEEPLMAKLLT
jgi:hypothetical protein